MSHLSANIKCEYCKGCGICIGKCPKHLLAMGTNINAKGYCTAELKNNSRCIGCGACAMMCPDLAIEMRSI